jgi:hypothetical protein
LRIVGSDLKCSPIQEIFCLIVLTPPSSIGNVSDMLWEYLTYVVREPRKDFKFLCGGRSVGIVRLRTEATELFFLQINL